VFIGCAESPSLSANRLSISNFEIAGGVFESHCPVVMAPLHGRYGGHKGCLHL
jgi:hypothetical protein